jgi:hypothetical protein
LPNGRVSAVVATQVRVGEPSGRQVVSRRCDGLKGSAISKAQSISAKSASFLGAPQPFGSLRAYVFWCDVSDRYLPGGGSIPRYPKLTCYAPSCSSPTSCPIGAGTPPGRVNRGTSTDRPRGTRAPKEPRAGPVPVGPVRSLYRDRGVARGQGPSQFLGSATPRPKNRLHHRTQVPSVPEVRSGVGCQRSQGPHSSRSSPAPAPPP